jgi:hypothetical protein
MEDERRRGEEIEAAIDQAHHAEQEAAYALLNVDPITAGGRHCVAGYARDYDDASYGMGRPDDITDDELKGNRTWQYFGIANLVEILPGLMPRVNDTVLTCANAATVEVTFASP